MRNSGVFWTCSRRTSCPRARNGTFASTWFNIPTFTTESQGAVVVLIADTNTVTGEIARSAARDVRTKWPASTILFASVILDLSIQQLPVLVESIVEGVAQGTAPGPGLPRSVLFDALFSIIGGVIALGVRDVVLRAAFVVFAAEHVTWVVAGIAQKPLGPWVGNGFIGAFGALLVLAGGRQSGGRARTWAAVVFVSAMILRFATLRYAEWLVGNRSVV